MGLCFRHLWTLVAWREMKYGGGDGGDVVVVQKYRRCLVGDEEVHHLLNKLLAVTIVVEVAMVE